MQYQVVTPTNNLPESLFMPLMAALDQNNILVIDQVVAQPEEKADDTVIRYTCLWYNNQHLVFGELTDGQDVNFDYHMLRENYQNAVRVWSQQSRLKFPPWEEVKLESWYEFALNAA